MRMPLGATDEEDRLVRGRGKTAMSGGGEGPARGVTESRVTTDSFSSVHAPDGRDCDRDCGELAVSGALSAASEDGAVAGGVAVAFTFVATWMSWLQLGQCLRWSSHFEMHSEWKCWRERAGGTEEANTKRR